MNYKNFNKKRFILTLLLIGFFLCYLFSVHNPTYRSFIDKRVVVPVNMFYQTLSAVLLKKQIPSLSNELELYIDENLVPEKKDIEEPIKISEVKNKALYQIPLYSEYKKINPENILSIINLERNKSKMRSLSFDNELNISAQKKADEMLGKQYFSHTTPDGKDFTYFVDYAGYEFMRVSENLAQGDFYSSRDIVLAWMNSPTHKANIFDDSMLDTGIGISFGKYKGNEGYFIVQHFGRPRGSCPLVDRSFESEIRNMTERGKSLYSEIKKTRKQIDDILNNNPDVLKRESVRIMQKKSEEKIHEYNAVVDTLQDLTSRYNAQIKAFNECNIGGHT